MTSAMEKVRETGVPIKTAARQFGLPGSSLRHKLSGRVGSNPFRPQPILSIQEEHHFVQHIKFMSEWFQSSFRKAGIYPLNPDIVHRPTSSHQKLFNKKTQKTHNSTTMQFLLPATLSYFARRSQPNQKHRCLSAVVCGKAITEPEVHAKIVDNQHASVKKTKEQTVGPSPLQTPHLPVVLPDSDSDVETDDCLRRFHMCAHTSSAAAHSNRVQKLKNNALITFYGSVQMCTYTSSAFRFLHPPEADGI